MPMILPQLEGTGKYHPNYNPKVHGLYDPSRNYGKVQKRFLDVRVGELSQWLIEKEKSPAALAREASRVMWNLKLRYISARHGNPMFLMFPIGICAAYCAKGHFHHVYYKTKYH